MPPPYGGGDIMYALAACNTAAWSGCVRTGASVGSSGWQRTEVLYSVETYEWLKSATAVMVSSLDRFGWISKDALTVPSVRQSAIDWIARVGLFLPVKYCSDMIKHCALEVRSMFQLPFFVCLHQVHRCNSVIGLTLFFMVTWGHCHTVQIAWYTSR